MKYHNFPFRFRSVHPTTGIAFLSQRLDDMQKFAAFLRSMRLFYINVKGTGISGDVRSRLWGSFMSIRGSYQTIWNFPPTNVKWQSVIIIYNESPLLIRLYTKPWPYYRSRHFTELWGFRRTFATDVACRQGTLTLPPDTWSRPIWNLRMFYLLRRIIFPNLS